MGVLGVIGLIVIVGAHQGFVQVSTGYYYFWLFVVIAEWLLDTGLTK